MRKALFTLLVLVPAGCHHDATDSEASATPGDAGPVRARTIALPGVGGPADRTGIVGRVDHLAFDPATGRLFVACLANGSLEAVDSAGRTPVEKVAGLARPQGVAVVGKHVFVSTGGDGRLRRYDARTLAGQGSAAVGEDADNIRVGPDGRVWVSSGGAGPGKLTPFDPETMAPGPPIGLPRMPEGFQLDPAGGRVFVNLPFGKQSPEPSVVAAVKVPGGETEWEKRLPTQAGNFPMAFDPAAGRLFVATRRPPRLIVLSAGDGTILGEAECPPDSDDLFFDTKTGRVWVVGGGSQPGPGQTAGAGASLDAFALDDAGRPSRLLGVALPPQTRTGLLLPDRRVILVAVPPREGHPAELQEFILSDSAR
jgi:DNA-binding beta-propeller fold protein YncE